MGNLAILSPSSVIAGTITGVTRGMRTGNIDVQIETPHGYAHLALPVERAAEFLIGRCVEIHVSVEVL